MAQIKELKEKKPSYFHKILGIKVRQNAMIEINNLISTNKKQIIQVSSREISTIAERYKIDLEKHFRKQKLEIYHKFLTHYVKKEQVDEDMINNLQHLSILLSIQKDDCKKEMEKVCAESYHRKVKKIMEEQEVDLHEQENLECLKKALFDTDI